MTEEMYFCVLHCSNFPVNGFSLRRSCRKTGHQRKQSISEPYGVCCWCVLQMGIWKTWWPVGEGGMREIHGSRLWQQQSMKPGNHIKHGTIFQSNCQAAHRFCSEVESENHQTEEWLRHSQLGTSKKVFTAMVMPQNITCSQSSQNQYCSSV